MVVTRRVPGASRLPGRTCVRDEGAVTVEAAVSLLAITAVVAMLAGILGILGAQLAVGEASRAGARAAARGESRAALVDEVHRLAPDARVEIDLVGDRVDVRVVRQVSGPGPLSRLGSVRLEATTSAASEGGA